MLARLLFSVVLAVGWAPTAACGTSLAPSAAAPAASARPAGRCPVAPPWGSRPTRFGISLDSNGHSTLGQDLRFEQRRFGTRVPVVRTWDDRLPTRTPWSVKARWYGTRWVVTSIRVPPRQVLSGAADGRLRHYFRTAPRSAPIFWNYWHEPEDEVRAGRFTAGQYRRAFRHVARIAASFCRPNLYPTLVLMGWSTEPAATPAWGRLDPGRRFVSVYAWDPYDVALGNAVRYLRPARLFQLVVAASRQVHRPFAIAETGSVRVPGDRTGRGRAAWLRAVARYARRHRAVFVTYYQSNRNGDFALRSGPEIRAWRDAMS